MSEKKDPTPESLKLSPIEYVTLKAQLYRSEYALLIEEMQEKYQNADDIPRDANDKLHLAEKANAHWEAKAANVIARVKLRMDYKL